MEIEIRDYFSEAGFSCDELKCKFFCRLWYIGSKIQKIKQIIYWSSVIDFGTMSFHTMNYASHVMGYVDMNRNMYKTRLSPALAVPPSSILLCADESGKSAESKKGPGSNAPSRSSDSTVSLPSQANTVGIIGGVSVVSTLNFLRKLVKWSSKDGESSLPFILHSDSVLYKEFLSHESSFPSLRSKRKCTRSDPTTIVENLRSKRAFLENSGARCIVMPCNISHSWHDEVSKGCSVPFLHMGESVARELKEAKLKPLEAGSHLRIGVLATNATLASGFYQEKLQNEVNSFCGSCLLLFFLLCCIL